MSEVILPGLVVAHTHLYSALARGMPAPPSPPRDFEEILRGIWWRLDRALDADSIRTSARVGIAEAVRSGATCLIDHHESPNAIEGSLELIADEMEAAGVRGVVAYGITGRNRGEREWRAGLAENRRFLSTNQRKRVRGMVGVHACFTVPDDALRAAASLAREFDTGLHIHVAEGAVDGDAVSRLRGADALVPGSIFAHAIHLEPPEVRLLGETGWVVQNPRSNMGNGVGYARHGPAGARAVLGTDGWDGDLLREARALAARSSEAADAVDVWSRLTAGSELSRSLWPDAAGDCTVVEYEAPTPLQAANLGSHMLFGRPTILRVDVGGKTLRPVFDAGEAREQAKHLWERMERVA